MVAPRGFLTVLVFVACGAETLPVRGTSNGETTLTAACTSDETCPAGMVCEGCNGPHDAVCVPGCRDDAQCPRRHICRAGVTCLTCPCAPGWCELDPCRDVDGDGYAFSKEPGLVCPGKRTSDCNDGNGAQHPGAAERCANGVDDDCDGLTDRNDPSCLQCTADSQPCNDAAECLSGAAVGGETCSSGCCQTCPLVTNPRCQAGERSVGGGLDPVTSCRVARVCISSACAGNAFEPWCGRDFAFYRNPCELREAGAEPLHRGGCLANEGRPCAVTPCPEGLFCRVDDVAGPRCTQRGACVVEADCPAGLDAPSCVDGGPTWRCERSQCVSACR